MEETPPTISGGNGNGANGSESPLIPGLNAPAGRGRGRPPGSKTKNRPIDLGGKNESVPARHAEPQQDAASAKFIGEAVVTLLELAETFVHNNCAKRIEEKLPRKIDEFRAIIEKNRLQEKEKELVADSTAKIAARHDWMTRFAPEVVLAVTLGQYSLRQLSLVKMVSNATEGKTREVVADISTEKPA